MFWNFYTFLRIFSLSFLSLSFSFSLSVTETILQKIWKVKNVLLKCYPYWCWNSLYAGPHCMLSTPWPCILVLQYTSTSITLPSVHYSCWRIRHRAVIQSRIALWMQIFVAHFGTHSKVCSGVANVFSANVPRPRMAQTFAWPAVCVSIVARCKQ